MAVQNIKQARGGYKIGDEVYPRVTSVLGVISKPGLDGWRKKVGFVEADRIMAEAHEHGNAVHAGCELIAKGDTVEAVRNKLRADRMSTDVIVAVEAFGYWFRKSVSRVVGSEQICWSNMYRYAGQTDLLVELADGRRAVLDIKTSNSLSETYRLQLRAYQMALAERGDMYDTRMVVWLPKTYPGRCVTRPYLSDEDDSVAWLAALDLYRWKQSVDKDWIDDRRLVEDAIDEPE